MHPSRHPTDASRINLIGTLLSGSALAWFTPLLEKQSPLRNNFEDLISEFKACFGDTDNIRTTINKIRRLRQGDRPASAYMADFRLLALDIPSDDHALMEQFRYGLRNCWETCPSGCRKEIEPAHPRPGSDRSNRSVWTFM